MNVLDHGEHSDDSDSSLDLEISQEPIIQKTEFKVNKGKKKLNKNPLLKTFVMLEPEDDSDDSEDQDYKDQLYNKLECAEKEI